MVIAGGPGDRAAAAALLRELGGNAEDFAGRSTLGETAAILAGARLVVSNETAAAHIAAAVGTPAVCVLGGGHYGRFMPYQAEEGRDHGIPPIVVARKMDCYGCNWDCIYPRGPGEPVRCIKEIAAEEVWRQVEACLARDRGPR